MKYSVALEDGIWRFRWHRQARRHFEALKLCPGEVAILSKAGRKGTLEIIDARYHSQNLSLP